MKMISKILAVLLLSTTVVSAQPYGPSPVPLPTITAPWTATDASGASLSLTTNVARFVQIGPLVWVYGNITYPSTANGSFIKVGLPVTVLNASGGAVIPACPITGGGATDYGFFNPNAATMVIYADINKGTQRTNANYSTITMTFNCWYPAS